MDRKSVKFFDAPGFGFQVRVFNAPLVKIRGEWALDVDDRNLQREVLSSLSTKPVRLTGAEIRYIRNVLGLTIEEFAVRFDASRATVLKWERAKNKSTGMSWATEKDIRLSAALKVQTDPLGFVAVYYELEEKADDSEMLIKISASRLS